MSSWYTISNQCPFECYVLYVQTAGEPSIANLDWMYHRSTGDTHTADWRLQLQKAMHNYAGVYRNEDLLLKGCNTISNIATDVQENIRVRTCMLYIPNFPPFW